jgi:DNA invertase Pin-like site-specific DNA recombinase
LTTTTKRGRPRADQSPKDRDRHVQALILRTIGRCGTREVARAYDVSERTVRNWTRRAMDYDDARLGVAAVLLGLR